LSGARPRRWKSKFLSTYTGGTRVTIWDPVAEVNIPIVNQLSPNGSFRFVTAVSITPDCPTDLDSDGVTGGSDLAVLLGAWASLGGDVNGDGTTDGIDLAAILGAWGANCQ
jgi:hypothetical protein